MFLILFVNVSVSLWVCTASPAQTKDDTDLKFGKDIPLEHTKEILFFPKSDLWSQTAEFWYPGILDTEIFRVKALFCRDFLGVWK